MDRASTNLIRSLICPALAYCLALGACAALRDFSVRRKLLDQPNERSLHKIAVPRLGGIAVVLGTWITVLAGTAAHLHHPGRNEWLWLAASVPITAMGLADDLRPRSATTRLLFQSVTTLLFCVAVGIPHGLPVSPTIFIAMPPSLSLIFWVLFIVGLLNIFNFMDGMDGLAGTQSIGAALGIGIAFAALGRADLAALCAILGAASAGFLSHNFPPARIFLGDAGSTFLGFTFGALAMLGARSEPLVPLPVFLFALAPFLLDGVSTLVRRALRGEPVWKAHRSHLYQRAVTAGRSHLQVLGVYAVWILVAAVASIWAASAQPRILIGLTAALTAGLAVVWLWVLRLEQKTVQMSDSSRNH